VSFVKFFTEGDVSNFWSRKPKTVRKSPEWYNRNRYNLAATQSREQKDVVDDPANRKHGRTVPEYKTENMGLPGAYKALKSLGGPKSAPIGYSDVLQLMQRFGVNPRKVEVGKPVRLKNTGLAIEYRPNNTFHLIRTRR
jgi:hypothetical protein